MTAAEPPRRCEERGAAEVGHAASLATFDENHLRLLLHEELKQRWRQRRRLGFGVELAVQAVGALAVAGGQPAAPPPRRRRQPLVPRRPLPCVSMPETLYRCPPPHQHKSASARPLCVVHQYSVHRSHVFPNSVRQNAHSPLLTDRDGQARTPPYVNSSTGWRRSPRRRRRGWCLPRRRLRHRARARASDRKA